MAAGSEQVSFQKYGVHPVCDGCGRKLVKKDERALWFHGYPKPTRVYGYCCWAKGARL